MTSSHFIAIPAAKKLVADVFTANGVDPLASASVAEALVEAEASGQRGHGFSRINAYLAQVASGKINVAAKITSSQSRQCFVTIDADGGFAYPALEHATDALIRMARRDGLAAVSVYNSHHCGALSPHVERLSRNGLIAIMFANAPKAMAPWGGSKPLFGTNPIAFSVPRDPNPVTIDMSLSRVARGKVMHAHQNNLPIPDGWALDKDGNPTNDAKAALEGTMLPIGDAKGASLALMVEILAAALTGSNFSHEASSFFDGKGARPGVGQFILAIEPAAGASDFADRLETLLEQIAAQEGTRLPGSNRLKTLGESRDAGFTVSAQTLAHLKTLAYGPVCTG
jgi:(2R)-3-sulfolactate dehydrogenase (NADP+)